MPIFHLSMKAVQRSGGRSAAASAAYRSGQKIPDPRQGRVWEYRSREERIQDTCLVVSGREDPFTRQSLWSGIENHHKRKDACTAREIEVALPHEIPKDRRKALARELGRVVSEEFGVAVDVSVHTSAGEGDNWHAHLLCTTVAVDPKTGSLGKKVQSFDPHECGKNGIEKPADKLRPIWEAMVNRELERAGVMDRVDHRTLKAQGKDYEPTEHVGIGPEADDRAERNRIRKQIRALEEELAREREREDEDRKRQLQDVAPQAAQDELASTGNSVLRGLVREGEREADAMAALQTIRGRCPPPEARGWRWTLATWHTAAAALMPTTTGAPTLAGRVDQVSAWIAGARHPQWDKRRADELDRLHSRFPVPRDPRDATPPQNGFRKVERSDGRDSGR